MNFEFLFRRRVKKNKEDIPVKDDFSIGTLDRENSDFRAKKILKTFKYTLYMKTLYIIRQIFCVS
jgi:hypothetical protein